MDTTLGVSVAVTLGSDSRSRIQPERGGGAIDVVSCYDQVNWY